MMRSDNLNWYNHGGYTEMNAPSSNVNVTDEDKSRKIIVHETLSQKNSADVSEYIIPELKDKEHKEPSVTKEVKSYFNIFECGRNILYRLDVTYQ